MISSLPLLAKKLDPMLQLTLQAGWTIASPQLLPKIKDRLVRRVVQKLVPELIRADVDASVRSVVNSFREAKGINIKNKAYLKKVRGDLGTCIAALEKSDYGKMLTKIAMIVEYTLSYHQKGLLTKVNANLHRVKIARPELGFDLAGKLYHHPQNDYVFGMPAKVTFKRQSHKVQQGDTRTYTESFKIKTGRSRFHLYISRATTSGKIPTSIEAVYKDSQFRPLLDKMAKDAVSKLGKGRVSRPSLHRFKRFKAARYTFDYKDHRQNHGEYLVTFKNRAMYVILYTAAKRDQQVATTTFNAMMNSFFFAK